jgi:hypothetical protein
MFGSINSRGIVDVKGDALRSGSIILTTVV